MKVVFAYLADHASKTDTGKLNILGMFSQINGTSLPVVLQHAVLVVKAAREPGDLAGEYTTRLVMIGPGGSELYPAEFPIEIDPCVADAAEIDFIIEMGGIKFEEFGSYTFQIMIAHDLLASVPFRVINTLEPR